MGIIVWGNGAAWRRSALSECFSSSLGLCYNTNMTLVTKKNTVKGKNYSSSQEFLGSNGEHNPMTNKEKKRKEKKRNKNVNKNTKRDTPRPEQELEGQATTTSRLTEAGNGAAEQRRQGRQSSPPPLPPRTNREEVRTTKSSNPQPRTDPTSKDLEIHAEGRAGKRR